jgi:hypothetical protein
MIREEPMRKIFIAMAALTMVAITVPAASAQERTMTGAAIGAGAGAIVAGPVGAIAGGAIGAVVGGPRISRARYRSARCWRDRDGVRHCRRRR